MTDEIKSPKQLRFIDEYLTDLNGKQACIRAGYSEKTAEVKACQLLSQPSIMREVAKRKQALMEKALVTQEEVVKGLKAEAEFQGEGSSHSARIRAWEVLGKYLGMFTEKLEVEQDSKVNITVSYE